MPFRLVIGCNMGQYNTFGGVFTPDRYLVLDNIKEKTITTNSKIASQPLQSGDTMSDHMYREPTIYNVSGTFSLNGKNWNDDSYDFIQVGDRLTNIEEVFEKIKDNGILCTLVTLNYDSNDQLKNLDQEGNVVDASTRFRIRKNMALQGITWTELYNSINFSFSFHEVIMVEAQEYENLDEAERINLGLPNVNSPAGSSLGTVLQQTGDLQTSVVKMLSDNGYIKNDFLFALATIGQAYVALNITAACVAAVIAVSAIVIKTGATIATALAVKIAEAAAAKGILVAAGSTSAIAPVGTIVAAAVAIVAVVAVGIAAIIKKIKEKKKERIAFKLINGSPEQDGERLSDLLDKVANVVNQTTSNITVYNISSDEPQQVILNIAGEYYIINFEQNNVCKYGWEAKVRTLNDEPIQNMVHDNWCVVSSFADMNRKQNCWFRDNTRQFEVYLMNPAFSSDYNPTEDSLENVRKKLSGYTIFVSKGNIESNIKILENAIIDAVHMEGFVE